MTAVANSELDIRNTKHVTECASDVTREADSVAEVSYHSIA